jgi:hypothetical protein
LGLRLPHLEVERTRAVSGSADVLDKRVEVVERLGGVGAPNDEPLAELQAAVGTRSRNF